MKRIEGGFFSIEQAAGLYLQGNAPKTIEENKSTKSFEEIFREKASETETVKFSKHANERLQSRNISLTNNQLDRLNQGIGQARDKSIKESLVMLDDLAFIVNIKSNTVVTALEKNQEGNVFTNIDGAVIV